jgi:hypothetical protein
MAKSDPTQDILSELKSLNKSNNSFRDKILEYNRITASAAGTTANASKSLYDISAHLANLTDAFNNLTKTVSDISDTVMEVAVKPETGNPLLMPWERKRFQAIANIFKNILYGADKNKNKLQLLPNSTNTQAVSSTESIDKKNTESYENIANIFDKVLKISSLPIALDKISNILLRAELNRIEERKDTERSSSFKEYEREPVISKTPIGDKTKEKSNFLTDFLKKIPLIGDLFRIMQGLGTMLIAASPVIAFLSHFLSDEISPWQGTLDLVAKLKTLGGKTFGELSELILAKTTSIIQWPFKFLKEKIPSIFENIKIPFAKTGEKTAVAATEGASSLLKVGTKGGILSKLLGFAGTGIKAVAKGLSKIPILGSLLTLYFAYDRYKKGDYWGMLLDLASIAVLAIPGYGPFISLGLGILSGLRDLTDNEEDNKQFKLNAEKGFGNWIKDGMSDIYKTVAEYFSKKMQGLINLSKDAIKKIKDFFGFTDETPQVKTLPNPIKQIEDSYNKKIEESKQAMKSVSGRNSLEAKKKYQSDIEKLEKDRDAAIETIKKTNSELPLPRSIPPTTTLESKPGNPEKDSKMSYAEIQLMMDQNKILADQTNILKQIAEKDTKVTVNANSNNNRVIDNDVKIKQNISESRKNYLKASEVATYLLGDK